MNNQEPEIKLNPVPEKLGPMDTFDQWLADYLQQDLYQVERLLSDKTVTRFLIAWSLLESRYFEGFGYDKILSEFATKVTEDDAFQDKDFLELGRYFRDRYQDEKRYKNLMHEKSSEEFDGILSEKSDTLSDYQLIFMLLFVVYRFRCNIFHGNKGVESWLKYKKQIGFCLRVMQSLMSLTTDIRLRKNDRGLTISRLNYRES